MRQAAAEALAANGDRALAGALALRWTLGDEDPLVMLACMTGLLVLAPDHALPRPRDAMHGADDDARELAARRMTRTQAPRRLARSLRRLGCYTQ